MDQEVYIVCDKWRVRRMDKWNFVVEEYRASTRKPKEGEADDRSERWFELAGHNCGPYFGKVESAIMYLYEWRMRNDISGTFTLAEYIEEMKRIANEMRNGIKKAVA